MTTSDIIPILPEIILAIAACLILVVDPFLKKDKTAIGGHRADGRPCFGGRRPRPGGTAPKSPSTT